MFTHKNKIKLFLFLLFNTCGNFSCCFIKTNPTLHYVFSVLWLKKATLNFFYLICLTRNSMGISKIFQWLQAKRFGNWIFFFFKRIPKRRRAWRVAAARANGKRPPEIKTAHASWFFNEWWAYLLFDHPGSVVSFTFFFFSSFSSISISRCKLEESTHRAVSFPRCDSLQIALTLKKICIFVNRKRIFKESVGDEWFFITPVDNSVFFTFKM